MMENYSIKDLMRANHLRRWHTVDVVKEQSLSEHQWNVTILSIRIAEMVGLDDQTIHHLTMKALIHDMDEIRTGDLPSPYKEELRRTGGHGGHVDAGGHMGASSVREAEESTSGAAGSTSDRIIRAADLIDAWWWAHKYVLDKSVVLDTSSRLYKFRVDCMGDDLSKAIEQLLMDIA